MYGKTANNLILTGERTGTFDYELSSQTGVWRTGQNKSKYLVSDAIISSNPSYLTACLNTVIKSHAGTATLETVLKFSFEWVSDTVSYEYWRVNSIIYLTINSVLRRSNDRGIMMRISSCETALRCFCLHTGFHLTHSQTAWMFCRAHPDLEHASLAHLSTSSASW